MAKFTANLYRMNASHLEECELEYELILRGLSISEHRQDNERRLRSALRDDEKGNRDYLSWRGISEECAFIGNRLKEIEDSIIYQANLKSKSRLYHYYLRLRRCQVQTPREEENRYVLVDAIKDMLLKYFNELIENKDELYMQMPLDSSGTAGRNEIGQTRAESVSVSGINQRSTGAIPKSNEQARRVAFLSSTRDDEESLESNGDIIDDLVVLNSPVTEAVNPLISPERVQNTTPVNMSRRLRTEEVQTGNFQQEARGGQTSQTSRPPVFVSAFRPNSQLTNNFGQSSRDDFVHVSQIETYVQKCVSTILENQRTDRVGSDRINLLTDQLQNANIRGEESRYTPTFQRTPGSTPYSTSFRRQNDVQHYSVIPGNLNIPPSLTSTQRSSNVIFNRSLPHQPERIYSDRTSLTSGPNALRNPFDPPQTPNMRNVRNPPHHLCKIIGTWPKFCGDNNIVPLVSFLRTIDMLCRSYEIDKEELKPHAHLLFTGDAYTWYTTYVERFVDWDTLLYYLSIRYDNPNRDRYIKEEMRNRKQKPNELFSAFLTEIESLSQRLINPLPDIEKFDLVVENMKISYKRRLALEDIRSIEDLAQKCYRFDALESNLFSPKSRGTNADIHALSADEEESDEEYVNALNAKVGRRTNRQNGNKYTSEQNNEETGIICWNCRGNDHIWKYCPEEKRIFCHVCGHSGRTSFNCPNNHPTNATFAKVPKNELQENV